MFCGWIKPLAIIFYTDCNWMRWRFLNDHGVAFIVYNFAISDFHVFYVATLRVNKSVASLARLNRCDVLDRVVVSISRLLQIPKEHVLFPKAVIGALPRFKCGADMLAAALDLLP